MSQTSHRAIIQNGVAVPIEPFQVPDGTEVTVNISVDEGPGQTDQNQQEIFAILSHRYESGHTDTAERHNEHQP